MAVHTFEDLMQHVGHDVHVSRYISFSEDGTQATVNVAIECETCYTVLVDFENPNREGKTKKLVCSACGSDEVFYDAYVGVNNDNDVRRFDAVFCDNCGGETSLKTEEQDA